MEQIIKLTNENKEYTISLFEAIYSQKTEDKETLERFLKELSKRVESDFEFYELNEKSRFFYKIKYMFNCPHIKSYVFDDESLARKTTLDTSVSYLSELSFRVKSLLLKNNINTLRDVLNLQLIDLAQMNHLGRKGALEVLTVIEKYKDLPEGVAYEDLDKIFTSNFEEYLGKINVDRLTIDSYIKCFKEFVNNYTSVKSLERKIGYLLDKYKNDKSDEGFKYQVLRHFYEYLVYLDLCELTTFTTNYLLDDDIVEELLIPSNITLFEKHCFGKNITTIYMESDTGSIRLTTKKDSEGYVEVEHPYYNHEEVDSDNN